jgi:Protein of unknown function (DUF2804)
MANPVPPANPFPGLPYRGGPDHRPTGLALPPERMALLRRGRPLKQWRYVGVFAPQAIVCAAHVRVGGLRQAFWAIWDRERRELHERTSGGRGGIDVSDGLLAVRRAGIDVALTLEPFGDPVEVVSPHGSSYIWTRKQWCMASGTISADGHAYAISAPALIDDSAGYHARETTWAWAAGAGHDADGRTIGWNLVTGIHDAPSTSERTVWVDGAATEVAGVTFADDLSSVRFSTGEELRFEEESVRERRDNRIVVMSEYRQPLGAVTGTLPGPITLADGLGVMERHRARW